MLVMEEKGADSDRRIVAPVTTSALVERDANWRETHAHWPSRRADGGVQKRGIQDSIK